MTIFDEDFTINDTAPFGFDSVVTSAGATEEVIPLGAETTPSGAWSGTALRGGSQSTISLHRSYPWMPILGVIANWKAVQPVSYSAYVWPVWFDEAIEDAALADAAGHPYKISLRVMMGANAPVGPTGANWMIGGLKAVNNNRPVEVVNTVGNDSNAGAPTVINIPVPWDVNYRYHFENLLAYLETQLSGVTAAGATTTGGVNRADYVFMLAVAFATEMGSEMSIGYGPHQLVPTSGTLVVDGNTYTGTSRGYHDVINKASWAKHVPSAIRLQGAAAIQTWLQGQYKNGWDYSIQKYMDVVASVDSSVAWAGLFSDGARAATALVKKYIPIYGRSKLVSLETNLGIMPPNNADPLTTTIDRSQWSYADWSQACADLMLLVKAQTPAGTLPKMGFQTKGNKNSSGGYGCPPRDFHYAARDAYEHYGSQFIETYTAVFTDSQYGSANRTFAQNELDPALAVNAALVTTAAPVGGDNVFHVALPTAPAGAAYGLITFTDAADFWYLLDISAYTLTVLTQILESFITGTTGALGFALDETGHPAILWDGATVWSDSTLTVSPGDEVEVRHFVNGAASGFELRINQTLVVSVDNQTSDSAGINSVRIGLPEQIEGDVKISRVAGDDVTWVAGASTPPPGDPPSLTVSTLPPSITTTQIQVTALADSSVGIASVTVSVNDGSAQLLSETATPGQYRGTVTGLSGDSSGASVQNLLTITATDASDAALQTIIDASVAVVLPPSSGGGSVAFTKTLYLGTGQFAAMHDRFMTLGHFVEGVAPDVDTDNLGDVTAALLVSANGSDSTAVDIAAGWALVQGDDTDFQGMYADFNDASATLVSGSGAPTAGNQRVDIVRAFINDSEHTTRTPADVMQFGFTAGSPSAGASLTDKGTWPDLPASSLPLALVLWDSTGITGVLDVRKAYGPGIWAADGSRYRLAVTDDKLLGLEQVQPWPNWVVV